MKTQSTQALCHACGRITEFSVNGKGEPGRCLTTEHFTGVKCNSVPFVQVGKYDKPLEDEPKKTKKMACGVCRKVTVFALDPEGKLRCQTTDKFTGLICGSEPYVEKRSNELPQ